MNMKVADPLRKLAAELDWNHWEMDQLARRMREVADEIDRDHAHRMRQCQRETKRAFGRYIRAITEEYERSRKRRRGDWEK